MDIETAFANPEVEKNGVWVDYRDGSKVKIARAGNPNFVRVQEAKLKPYRRRQRNGTLDSETETRVLCDVLAETVLLEWEGFTKNGKPFPYSKSNASGLLQNSMDFRNEIVDMATSEDHFHGDYVEESEKNS